MLPLYRLVDAVVAHDPGGAAGAPAYPRLVRAMRGCRRGSGGRVAGRACRRGRAGADPARDRRAVARDAAGAALLGAAGTERRRWPPASRPSRRRPRWRRRDRAADARVATTIGEALASTTLPAGDAANASCGWRLGTGFEIDAVDAARWAPRSIGELAHVLEHLRVGQHDLLEACAAARAPSTWSRSRCVAVAGAASEQRHLAEDVARARAATSAAAARSTRASPHRSRNSPGARSPSGSRASSGSSSRNRKRSTSARASSAAKRQNSGEARSGGRAGDRGRSAGAS